MIAKTSSIINAAAKISVRPRKNTAEGGCGGNSAVFLQKIEASPAALLVKARHHRKILFSLGEKEIRRAQNEKSKEYFSVVRRALVSGGGAASLVGIGLVKSSDFVQETQPVRRRKPPKCSALIFFEMLCSIAQFTGS